ncbi:hypothetical protein BB561_006705 [Smittium simulii]|uniref:Mediator of RNA polymerase II transcription subunit 31 n=1 Tax=Smittium simulii TaxID=133385 RepID=A0A2T9Y2C0_9FUNG|nr:hypothetical protein BB561_006705 [Smittium simulii]
MEIGETVTPLNSELNDAEQIIENSTLNEKESKEQKRFLVELEFIQCLSNPWYIHYLAQQGYFEDKEFINYLNYLTYFKKPEYSKYIVYPSSLTFLDLLHNKAFRDSMKINDEATFIHSQQYHHWLNVNKNFNQEQSSEHGVQLEPKQEP